GFRTRIVFFVHRRIGRRVVEGQAEYGFAGSEDDVLDARKAARLEDVVAAGDVIGEGRCIRGHARSRDGGEMDYGVEPAALFVDAAQNGRGHLAEIGQVDTHARADRIVQPLLIDIEHVVAV